MAQNHSNLMVLLVNVLKRSLSQDTTDAGPPKQNCNFGVSQLVSWGCGLTGCANPVEDEVFEEEESEESEVGFSTPLPRGRLIETRRASRQAGLETQGGWLVTCCWLLSGWLFVDCWVVFGC